MRWGAPDRTQGQQHSGDGGKDKGQQPAAQRKRRSNQGQRLPTSPRQTGAPQGPGETVSRKVVPGKEADRRGLRTEQAGMIKQSVDRRGEGRGADVGAGPDPASPEDSQPSPPSG